MATLNTQNLLKSISDIVNFWPIKWLIIIGLVALIKKVIGLEFRELLADLMKEFRELLTLKPSPQGLDAACIVSVLVVGLVILACTATPEFIGLASHLGAERAFSELGHSASLTWLLAAVTAVGITSVIATR